jgi:5-methyltetrahydrofolate--homocysteine methyltransferase
LAAGGADLLWIETMSDLNEVKAAVEGAKSATDLPICATMTFDTNGHTMMGISPAKAVTELGKLGLAAVGANCGTGPDELEIAVAAMRAVDPDLLIIAKANAGIPHYSPDGLVYDGTPDVMADYAQRVKGLGVSLIGACCGSSPAHIAAMRTSLAQPISAEAMTQVQTLQAAARATATESDSTDDDTSRRRHRRRDR